MAIKVVDGKTEGLSPKVGWPVAVLAGVGVGLVFLGVVTANSDLVKVGFSVLGASGIALPVGFAASPGVVRPASQPINRR
jgi:hypothetical protein